MFLFLLQNGDCDPSTTIHVDAFLYDDDLVDELCDQEKLPRNYCVSCGSKNTKPLSKCLIVPPFLKC
jgi:hypothetical protein